LRPLLLGKPIKHHAERSERRPRLSRILRARRITSSGTPYYMAMLATTGKKAVLKPSR
jgi:hypothetical protein